MAAMHHLIGPARLAILVHAAVTLAACSSAISLKPTTPADSAQVAQADGVTTVQVGIDASMPADRTAMLEKAQVPQQLMQAVLGSFAQSGMQKAGGVDLDIQIHAYRISNWGPSRMGAKVTVKSAAGEVIKSFEAQSATVRGGSTATRTERLAQELVQKIVDAT